ncbi:hypothetical protein H6M51_20745 [Rhizobium sp. AQ_MP]|uniref:hypothetical protein n=1 Tax=Rhizobium sp. AQ_MP TaxID=2761536 RepID=UPI00163AFEEE|nr:hypothetical protein [Rhizobium sp. AQ_MP]MBC2775293.1 hypothetical protein [Rhizobium sp. AQ_MP]
MSKALLALWNDYPTSLTDEYETWHSFEHVPERMTTPGMLSATRFGILGEERNRFFTLYALEELDVLQHPQYLDLVRHPTEWSVRMRQYFLNVLRIPTTICSQEGSVRGGRAIVQAWSVEKACAEGVAYRLGEMLKTAIGFGQILNFSLGLAEPNQFYEVFEQSDMTDPDTLNVVIIAEGSNQKTLETFRADLKAALLEFTRPRSCLRDDIFELLAVYPKHDDRVTRADLRATTALRARFVSLTE